MPKRKHSDTHQFAIAYRRANRGGRRIRHYRFSGQVLSRLHQELMDTGEAVHSKRGKHHEAHLIPGVDGQRIWGFPNSIITKIRYCDNISLTCTSGARGINVFSANGIFDPDVTGVGHQPMYRDNFAALYNQYVVIGSKIVVHFSNRATVCGALIGINGDDDSTSSTNVPTLMEQNNSVHSLINNVNSLPGTLTATFEPLRDFGVDVKDDGSSATALGSNPTENWCFVVWAAAADQASTIIVDIAVEIEYTVKFTELVTPTQN